MFNEIGAFIQKYYIDAVLEDQPYNIYLTITCAILLLVTLYLLYRWARANNIRVDTQLILASMPFVIFGGVLRVVEDTGCIPEPWWVLFVTPPIFFLVLLYTIFVLVLSRTLENHGFISSYTKPYFWVGVASNLVCLAFLCWWGITQTELALWVAGCILVMAAVVASPVLGLTPLWFFLGIRDTSVVQDSDLWSASGCICHKFCTGSASDALY